VKVVPAIGFLLQKGKDTGKCSILHPTLEISIAGNIRDAVIMGEVAPATPGGEDIEDAIRHFFKVCAWPARLLLPYRKMRRQHLKLP